MENFPLIRSGRGKICSMKELLFNREASID